MGGREVGREGGMLGEGREGGRLRREGREEEVWVEERRKRREGMTIRTLD